MPLLTVLTKCIPISGFFVRSKVLPGRFTTVVGLGLYVGLAAAIGGALAWIAETKTSARIQVVDPLTGSEPIIWRQGE